MILQSLFCCLIWLGASLISAVSLTGPRVLVVNEDKEFEGDYHLFLSDLEARGFQLDIRSPKSEGLELFSFGERVYDHVLLFPPASKGYGPALTPQLLVEFMDKDGNILLVTSPSNTPEQARELARELDIDLPSRDYLTVDHFNYDALSNSEKHDLIVVPRPTASKDTKNYFSGSAGEVIAFRGTGHALGNRPLLFPILRGSRTAYTYDTKEDFSYVEDPYTAGTQLYYATAMQARNNARFVVVGSTDMFSDEFFGLSVALPGGKKQKVANREFAKEVTQWCFQETGILKTKAIRHYLTNVSDAEINPHLYRVKNDITFEIELSEWNGRNWVPFSVPSFDSLQLEFTMLDPYYRVPLLPSSTTADSTVYSTSFRAPDQHGVFAFHVNYKRPFVTYIEEKYSVTVRHFAHDEYTRSYAISGAWVWIAGIAVTVTGWMLFCALWLWSKPTETSVKKTQ